MWTSNIEVAAFWTATFLELMKWDFYFGVYSSNFRDWNTLSLFLITNKKAFDVCVKNVLKIWPFSAWIYLSESRIETNFACINFRKLAAKFSKFTKIGTTPNLKNVVHAKICTLNGFVKAGTCVEYLRIFFILTAKSS